MSIRIYNTLTRNKEPFETLEPNVVSMYVCGPTVYADAHIGHAMSALVFDIIRRYLEYKGYQVRHVMNYTDVDDKIIFRANELGVDPFDLAEGYIQKYRHHLDDLNILQATVNPRATQEMDTIIEMIKTMIEKGRAYPADGDVYFRVSQDEDYGQLSRRNRDDMLSGVRIDVDERKESPMDFALWKSAKPNEPAWDSPWGEGRPGWHIECSAMNLTHLGEQIDIHGGGNDLIFPHHENEIAQTESVTGKQFARYWVHNGMLQLAGEKMSKSLGNLITIEELLEKHDADVFRMLILNSSYRNPLTFSQDVLIQAKKGLDRLRSALRPANSGSRQQTPIDVEEALAAQIEKVKKDFDFAMEDDFNTAGALGGIFDFVRAVNHARDLGANPDSLSRAQKVLLELTGVFGLSLAPEEAEIASAAPFIDLLVAVRREIREQKLWSLSDKIRDQLKELGVVIEDGKEKSHWFWE